MAARKPAPAAGHASRSQVRIIGGSWRGRRIEFQAEPGLRPTPDRVRETLFNWLGQDLPGWVCLDLFAGSGALGFEAVSRGAGRVVMVERDAPAMAALQKNRATLGADQADLQRADAMSWLANNRETFDLVFLDPPFDSGLAGQVLADLARHLKSGGHVYVEQGTRVIAPSGFIIHRSGRAGRSHFALLVKD